jgi:stage III sporulation protein AA
MATVINQSRKDGRRLPEKLYDVFPSELVFLLEGVFSQMPVDEIRLRTDRRIWITSGGKNVPLEATLGRAQIDGIVDLLCDGSLYAHADTLRRGYVRMDGGIRVGIVGRAAVENGEIIGIYDVSALCFRLPRKIYRVGAPVCELVRELGVEGGVLVYSRPGQGKTTLLRSVCHALASGSDPMRIAVVDTRGELGFSLEDGELCVDVLTDYPRHTGLEIAARTMNAQLAVCDEIGGEEEVDAIIGILNCGVPLLPTAHATNVRMLLRRDGFARLHKARVFGAYVGISREGNDRDYTYVITSWEEAEEYLKDSGGLVDSL